jgi:hypothetical protein
MSLKINVAYQGKIWPGNVVAHYTDNKSKKESSLAAYTGSSHTDILKKTLFSTK